MRFGLAVNVKKAGAKEAINQFLSWISKSDHELFLTSDLKEYCKSDKYLMSPDEISTKIDIMVSMGGDGTMLYTARLVGKSEIPILGINLGSLGFLTQHRPNLLEKSLDAIVKKEYEIEKRMILMAESDGELIIDHPFALNDIIIDNGPISRLIDIELAVNQEHVTTYRADGLVIATPTGSTAYSLAVGGPIMHPKLEAIIASPISSFSLSTRPMIFDSSDQLEIRIHSEHELASMTIDGQVMHSLKNSDVIKIKKADHYVKLVTFRENSYYRVLERKLHWGLAPKGKDEQ